ncbi:MAG: hypothetical protein JW744_03255 [Candidatus Diapherotrites archaeon]|uniref:dolichyl-phosphooligosaccharide-protein glycotransferase n=1 Tax=Candidatus Iainarchaeum sp. TaxID=3101447 RepID=A0A939C7A8_9ARCH|nr:hypothetical protein [Candidatus Diapherotrites archaeon]
MGKNYLVEKAKGINKKQLFLLAIIFLLAFGTRGHLLIFEYMFGFDSYYHARMVGFVIENGYVPVHDTMSYYFMGGATPPTNTFFWYFTAAIYKICTFGAAYDKMLWVQFVKVLPALFGALISVAMFFLGREIYGKKAGYAMAFAAAIVPSFVYRTLAGFFEEDSLGFLWLVIGLVFFVRAVKNPVFNRKGVINAAVAGIFFGIMALTWEMFLLIPLVLGGYFVFALIHIYSKRDMKQFFDFIKLFAVSAAILSAIATLNYGTSWISKTTAYAMKSIPGSLEFAAFAGAVLLIALLAYLGYGMRKQETRESNAKTINLIAMLLLYGIFLALVVTFVAIPNLFQETSVLGQSVGEENTGKQFFASKYNGLIVFPVLALLLIPIRMYREKNEHLSAMIFFWILITFFMAWYKLKFTYTFGLPIAASVGLVTKEVFYYFKGRSGIEVKAVAIALGLMMLVGAAAAAIFVPDNFPHIEQTNPNWKNMLHWMQNPENTPKDAKIFNWWDEGHWISFIGERAVLIDNRNLSWEGDQDFARFAVTSSLNEAIEIIKRYGSDYIVLSNDMFLKISSFGNYAYNASDSRDPRIINFLYTPHYAVPCSKTNPEGAVIYTCGGNRWNEEQMNSIPTTWKSQAFNVTEQSVPYFFYRDPDNMNVYFINFAVNDSMLAKVWFQEPETAKYFEVVYAEQGLKIFRVNKEALQA